MEFQLDNFKGKVEEPIGKHICFLKVLGEDKGICFVPMIFWLQTSDNQCYRFFIDAWVLHWTKYSQIEMKELIEEDFDEYDSYRVKDLMLDYNLNNKVIKNVEMNYIEEPEKLIGKLLIEIEEKGMIELLDFGDIKEQELKINMY